MTIELAKNDVRSIVKRDIENSFNALQEFVNQIFILLNGIRNFSNREITFFYYEEDETMWLVLLRNYVDIAQHQLDRVSC